MYDTIIIGAGMSGLAAGIRLAYYDQRVCILERHYTIGGLNSFYRLRGRDYDVGLHAVTNFTPKGTADGPLARLLRQLRFNWEDFALAADRLVDSLSRRQSRLRQRHRTAAKRDRARVSRLVEATCETAAIQLVDYDDLAGDDPNFNRSARTVLEQLIPIRCSSKCCSAR